MSMRPGGHATPEDLWRLIERRAEILVNDILQRRLGTIIRGGVIQGGAIGGSVPVSTIPVFGASGASHTTGLVPDPGSVAGTTRYLREDATFDVPPGGLASPLTTKGDVWGYSTTDARVPVGADGDVLTADSTQALGVKWAASTGTGALALITDTTVSGSAAALVTISSIPNTYKHLFAMWKVRDTTSAGAQVLYVRVNGDTGSTYNAFNWQRTGYTSGSTTGGMRCGASASSNQAATRFGTGYLYLYDYTSAAAAKEMDARSHWIGADDPEIGHDAGAWIPTSQAAITSLSWFLASGNIDLGSRFLLYGIN